MAGAAPPAPHTPALAASQLAAPLWLHSVGMSLCPLQVSVVGSVFCLGHLQWVRMWGGPAILPLQEAATAVQMQAAEQDLKDVVVGGVIVGAHLWTGGRS